MKQSPINQGMKTTRRRALFASVAAAVTGVASTNSATNSPSEEPAAPEPLPVPQPGPVPGVLPTSPPAKDPAATSSGPISISRSPDRSAAEQDVFRSIIESLSNDFPLSTTGSTDGELAETLLRIENGFRFRQDEMDSNFSPYHTEVLLDQAADLLDRGIRDRGFWEETSSAWITQLLELNEYKDLDEIHRRETAAGSYEVAARISQSEFDAERSRLEKLREAQKQLSSLSDRFYSDTELGKLTELAQRAGWASGLPPYLSKDQKIAAYPSHNRAGIKKTVAEHQAECAGLQVRHRAAVEKEYAAIQSWNVAADVVAAEAIVAARQARANWETQNANFLAERTAVSRRYLDLKARAAVDPRGVLNAGRRLPAVKKRFHQDFRDAVARLRIASEGLKRIYGYNTPLPENDNDLDFFDDCLMWTRQAIQWLLRFSRLEQNFVFPTSVRDKMSHSAWIDGLAQRRLDFELPESIFPSIRHIRLRGVTLYVSGGRGTEEKIWQMKLSVPVNGKVIHANEHVLVLDQSIVKPVVAGRITGRQSIRDPDVHGLNTFHNCSPVGKWKLEILNCVPGPFKPEWINDIFIDLHLATKD